MPPKAKPGPVVPSKKPVTSRDLISTGPKDVSKHHGKRGDRGTREVRPTTEQALILRNGKYGARGTGEVVLMTKMTGREKLDLLAEDLVEKATKSLLTPFRFESCLKMAESQLSENLDDIANLKDHDLFFSIIEAEIKARNLNNKQKNGDDPTRNPSHIAQVVSDRIHNAYMLGSAWKIVVDLLYSLQEGGLTDEQVVPTLKTDSTMRSRYLVLYDLVNTLVDLSQRKFSVLATTTPHYSQYFKEIEGEAGEVQIVFDWQEVREACRSFLDSLIVELCFPRAPYPKAILYQLLHEAVDEAPKEARRFPQALWDAVGDLSVAVQLQQMLETPLLSSEARDWKNEPRIKLEPYDKWLEAQLWSEVASGKWANFKDMIFPLQRTKTKDVLTTMWKTINGNYKGTSGKDIDALWDLAEVLKPTPHWHAYNFVMKPAKDNDDDDGDGPPMLGGQKKKPLAITYRGESDDSMPELQDVSDSDESDGAWTDSDDSDDDSDADYSDESGYDTDQEDEIREMLREAMDVATGSNWEDPGEEPSDLDPFTAEDRKGNPFLKLLGSLRGRMFSKSTKLKTATGSKLPPKPASSKKGKSTPNTGKAGVTIEEVSDEDDEVSHPSEKKKKKKKKPKKKKKAAAPSDGVEAVPEVAATPPPPSPTPPPAVVPPKAPEASPKPPSKPKTAPSPAKPKVAIGASQSTASFFPLETVTTAQSARSYLQSEQLDAPKQKIKSRPDFASSFTGKAKGLFEKLGVGKEKKDTHANKKERRHWFDNMSKKTRTYMHQILNTAEDETKGSAGMKWDTFVKVLTDMGFTYVPTTAGSSVRFDPPSSEDRAISFHKPHPDSTIGPILLKEYSKKLQRYYGWTPADVMD